MALAPIGHNEPPDPLVIIRQGLDEQNRKLVRVRDFWLAELAKLPPEVTNSAEASRVTQTAADIGKAIREMDDAFKIAKAPYLEGGRVVDSHFKSLREPLGEAKNIAERLLTLWQRKLLAAEQARRDEVARLAREEAERAAREAAEKADSIQIEDDLADALDAEAMAAQAAADAVQAQQAAEAKAAEMSRTRGSAGATGSLRTAWVHGTIDRAAVDLEALRYQFSDEAMDKAIRAFIKAGGRKLRGVQIFEESTTRVRG